MINKIKRILLIRKLKKINSELIYLQKEINHTDNPFDNMYHMIDYQRLLKNKRSLKKEKEYIMYNLKHIA